MTKLEKVTKQLRTCIKGTCPKDCEFIKVDNCWMALVKDALDMLDDGDRVKVVRCRDCFHWVANNAEEGDSSGKCRRYLGMAENRTTDGWSFCSDGEAVE